MYYTILMPSWAQGSALLSVVRVQVKDFHHPLHLAGWLGGGENRERKRRGAEKVGFPGRSGLEVGHG